MSVGIILLYIVIGFWVAFLFISDRKHDNYSSTIRNEGETGVELLLKIVGIILIYSLIFAYLLGETIYYNASTIWTWLTEPP